MSNHVEAEDWLTVEEAADVLRLTTRQVNRYGAGDVPRLHTKRVSRRVLYLRQDVLDLAGELNVALKPKVHLPAKAEMMPAGEMLDYLRDRDARLDQLQAQLNKAAQENGKLSTLVDVQARQLQDTQAKLQDAQEENQQLRLLMAPKDDPIDPTPEAPAVPAKRPWWKRLLRS